MSKDKQPTSPSAAGGGKPAASTTTTCQKYVWQWDAPYTSDKKQYVNLPEDVALNYGPEPLLVGHVEPRKPGVMVTFTVVPNPANDPATVTATLNSVSATTDELGTAKVKLKLPHHGGLRFKVGGKTATMAKSADSGEITVWRRMWYATTSMKKQAGGKYELPAASLNSVVKSFKNVFVELKDSGEHNEGSFKDNFPTANDAFAWADKYCSAGKTPWKIHYTIVHHSANKEEKLYSKRITSAIHNETGLNFRPYDFDGASWLKATPQYRVGTEPWKNFPAGAVKLTGSNPSRNFSINFSGTGVTPTAAAPADVRFSYFKAFVANGWGGTNLHLVICRGSFDEYYSSAQREQAMAGTCIHEPGHTFGLVYGLGWETSDAGHSAHCKHKACVMWWQGYNGRPHDYHPKSVSNPGCHTYMCGLDMSKSAMESKWKFPR